MRRGLPVPGELSYVDDGTSGIDQTAPGRSGEGVCERLRPVVGGRAVKSSGKLWVLSNTLAPESFLLEKLLFFFSEGVIFCEECGSSARGPSVLPAGLVRLLPRLEIGMGETLGDKIGRGLAGPLMALSRRSTSSMASRSSGSSSTVGENVDPPKVIGG